MNCGENLSSDVQVGKAIEEDMNWDHQFRASGYAHFPGLTDTTVVDAALSAIERDLRDNYDAQRQVEYDNQSYCPDLKGTPPIMDLIEKSSILAVVDEALGLDNVAWDKGQIAIVEHTTFRKRSHRSRILTGSPAV